MISVWYRLQTTNFSHSFFQQKTPTPITIPSNQSFSKRRNPDVSITLSTHPLLDEHATSIIHDTGFHSDWCSRFNPVPIKFNTTSRWNRLYSGFSTYPVLREYSLLFLKIKITAHLSNCIMLQSPYFCQLHISRWADLYVPLQRTYHSPFHIAIILWYPRKMWPPSPEILPSAIRRPVSEALQGH